MQLSKPTYTHIFYPDNKHLVHVIYFQDYSKHSLLLLLLVLHKTLLHFPCNPIRLNIVIHIFLQVAFSFQCYPLFGQVLSVTPCQLFVHEEPTLTYPLIIDQFVPLYLQTHDNLACVFLSRKPCH